MQYYPLNKSLFRYLVTASILVLIIALVSYFTGSTNILKLSEQTGLGIIFLSLFVTFIFFIRKAGDISTISIVINENGIKFSKRYAGPIKQLPIDLNASITEGWSGRPRDILTYQDEKQFNWDEIQSIQFGRWQRFWNIFTWHGFLNMPSRWGVSYIIIRTTSSDFYLTMIPGASFSTSYLERHTIISILYKLNAGSLIIPEIKEF